MSKTIMEEALGEFLKDARSSGAALGRIGGMAAASVALNVALQSVPPPEGVSKEVWDTKCADIVAAYTEALKAQIVSHDTVVDAMTKEGTMPRPGRFP